MSLMCLNFVNYGNLAMSDMEHNKGKLIPFSLTEEVAAELVFSKHNDYILPDALSLDLKSSRILF